MDIRQQMIALRREFTGEMKMQADSSICTAILGRREFHKAKTICIYSSFHDEVDTIELLRQKKTFVVLEQKASLQFPDISKVDFFIVPGVAFDREGYRLGLGKGYYDRLLANVKAIKIGLAYSFQIVSRLPHKKYDIPMDIIITENETITP